VIAVIGVTGFSRVLTLSVDSTDKLTFGRVALAVYGSPVAWLWPVARWLKVAPPAGWTLTKRLPEEPAQMCLIRKAYAQRYFAQSFRTGHHQVAGSLQTPSHHVGMWRLANSQFELP
jgi:hypothetical protein